MGWLVKTVIVMALPHVMETAKRKLPLVVAWGKDKLKEHATQKAAASATNAPSPERSN